jgi:hypothetical protein
VKTRNKQCKACPWKKSVKPTKDIPGGYTADLHRKLACTIAAPGALPVTNVLVHMACHESPRPGGEFPCVGWLVHQLGPGNNIGLRLSARDGRYNSLKTVGPQHETFEDTLPDPESE